MLKDCLAACAHLTITVSEIERDIGGKSSFFHTPLAFDAPVRGFPVGIAPKGAGSYLAGMAVAIPILNVDGRRHTNNFSKNI